MAKKTLLTCTLLFGLSPLVTGCVTLQDHKNLQLRVRNQNSRIVDLEHQVGALTSGGGDSTKTLQRQQADLSSDIDRIKTQLLQMSGQLEESTFRNRTLLEENQSYMHEIAGKIETLSEKDTETEIVLLATSTQLNTLTLSMEEEAKRKQEAAIIAAERAKQKVLEAKIARDKAEKHAQKSPADSSVVALTPRKEKSKGTAQVVKPVLTPVKTSAPVKEIPATAKTAAEKLYDTGLREYRAEKYKDAVELFTVFLEQNPKHKLLPDAKYWLGASRLKDGDYSGAVLEFQHIVADYPQHPLAPEALLKQAEAFGHFGDKMVQEKLYKDVINYYPKSEQAKTAKVKLSKL